jgi:RNA polymerase sigma-70 factor (ECF subfamily)
LSAYQTRHAFDDAYVNRLVREDPDTERHFTQYFGDLLTLKLRARLRTPALVEDARQETFVRVLAALKQRGGLERAETLGAFVNAVCNNVLFELYRSQKRNAPPPDDPPEPAGPAGRDVESELMAAEDRARLRRALDRLPEKEQELLRWLFLEERDKDDVCRELKVGRDYLRVLLFRARTHLREQLETMGAGSTA